MKAGRLSISVGTMAVGWNWGAWFGMTEIMQLIALSIFMAGFAIGAFAFDYPLKADEFYERMDDK